MTRKTTHQYRIKWSVFLAFIMFVIVGCGSSTDLATDISGKWKSEQGNDRVDINLTKEASSLTIDGQTYKGVIESIDKGSNTVHVKVETDDGQSETWSIHQVWDDNGSTFNLTLRRNGTIETLIPAQKS
jgi:hypothetical protein